MLLGSAVCAALAMPAPALEALTFQTPGADDDLQNSLRAASLLAQAKRDKVTAPQDLFATARADYARILGTLYAEGYYSGVIRILIDGREAASIPPLEAPASIREITVSVTPGPRFAFSAAGVAPLAPGTALPDDYAAGKAAQRGYR